MRPFVWLNGMMIYTIALSVAYSAAQTTLPKPQKQVISAWTQLVGDEHVMADPQPTGHTVLRVITSATAVRGQY